MSHEYKIHNRFIRFLGLITIVVFGILSTLGTGGGGGDGTTSVQPLSYVGNTEPANITKDNATTLVANVLFGGIIVGDIPVAVTTSSPDLQSSETTLLIDRLSPLFKLRIADIIANNDNTQLPVGADVPVSGTMPCDNGINISFTGTLDNVTLLGTVTFTYSNCVLSGVTYNGTVIVRFDAVDIALQLPTDMTMNFSPLMTIVSSNPAFNVSATGSVRLQINISTDQEIYTMNFVSKDNSSGKMFKFENLKITNAYDNVLFPNSYSQTFGGAGGAAAGRVYDSIHGYVDVTTPGALMYSSITLSFPDSGGPMLFDGVTVPNAGPMRIRLNVLNATQISIDLDLDGNGIYELGPYDLLWTDLLAPQPLP
jgi:hypothetical protein